MKRHRAVRAPVACVLALLALTACETPPEGGPPAVPTEREALIVGGDAPRIQELDEEGRSVVIGGRAPNAAIARPTPMARPEPEPVAPRANANEPTEAEAAEAEPAEPAQTEQPVISPAPVILVDPRAIVPAPGRPVPVAPRPQPPSRAGDPGVITGQHQRPLGGAGDPGVITGRAPAPPR